MVKRFKTFGSVMLKFMLFINRATKVQKCFGIKRALTLEYEPMQHHRPLGHPDLVISTTDLIKVLIDGQMILTLGSLMFKFMLFINRATKV